MAKVFVITGETGAHDDIQQWIVGVCLNEGLAQQKVEKLTQAANAAGVLRVALNRQAPANWQQRQAAIPLLWDAGDSFVRDLAPNGVTYEYKAAQLLE